MMRGKYEGMPVYLYENVDVFPRVFWVSRIANRPSDAEILDAISTAPISELRSTAFLRAKAGAPASFDHLDTGRTLEITKYSADEIKISFSKGSRGFLVIANSYSKFWTARCGDTAADVVPADHALQGIAIPPDCEQLTLSYRRPGI